MLLRSLLLLLIAAMLHALTNLFMKQSRDKIAFVWWMVAVTIVLGAPILLLLNRPQPIAWVIICVSGILEGIYFFTLTRAYSSGDLSLVCPIARCSAPLFLFLWAIAFLHEHPTGAGACGIFLIVIGLYLINLRSIADWARPFEAFRSPASRWA